MSLHASQSAIYPQPSSLHNVTEAQVPIRLHGIDPLPMNPLTAGSSAMSMMLMVGSFSLLLTFFWLRICRLTSLVQRRDQRIRKLLSLDSLTSLNNRETLLKAGEQLLLAHPKANIGLLSTSVHRFKAISDEFGHAVGDELLQQMSCRLRTCLGASDTLARTEFDEFSILLGPHYELSGSPPKDAFVKQTKALAHRMLSVIHQPFYVQSQIIRVEASLGVAISVRTEPADQISFDQLLARANVALRYAKKMPTACYEGRCTRPSNRYALFSPEIAAQEVRRVQMRRDLAQAIDRQELRLRYQPIVSFKTGKTTGFEALVRWQHPTMGLLSPNHFLPLAEEMDLMVEIDRWVMESACQRLAKWQAQQLYPSLSVNLSGEQLNRTDVTSFVRSLISRYAISPAQLNLEVTENVLIAEPDQAIETLRQLKKMGLRLSLDDFGTGYSSLEYLHQFPVDVLKIDKSFIHAMNRSASLSDSQVQTDSQSQVILRSILALAKGLGLEVVAEGIECADQCDQLREMQCTYGQGNFFAGPVTGISALVMLKEGNRKTPLAARGSTLANAERGV